MSRWWGSRFCWHLCLLTRASPLLPFRLVSTQRLAGDYTLWATGRDREASLKGGEMAALAQRMLAGGRGKLPEGVVELPVGDDEAGAGAASGAPGPGGGSGSSAGRGFGRG